MRGQKKPLPECPRGIYSHIRICHPSPGRLVCLSFWKFQRPVGLIRCLFPRQPEFVKIAPSDNCPVSGITRVCLGKGLQIVQALIMFNRLQFDMLQCLSGFDDKVNFGEALISYFPVFRIEGRTLWNSHLWNFLASSFVDLASNGTGLVRL